MDQREIIQQMAKAASALEDADVGKDLNVLSEFKKPGEGVIHHSGPKKRGKRELGQHQWSGSAYSKAISAIVDKAMCVRNKGTINIQSVDDGDFDMPDLEGAPLSEIYAWISTVSDCSTDEPVRESNGSVLHPLSFSSKLYSQCADDDETELIKKENILLQRELSRLGVDVPEYAIDPLSSLIMINPVYSVDGRILDESTPCPKPKSKDVTRAEIPNFSRAKDILMWKVRVFLLYFKPYSQNMIEIDECLEKNNQTKKKLPKQGNPAWQYFCHRTWISFADENRAAIDNACVQQQHQVKVVLTSGVRVFNFLNMTYSDPGFGELGLRKIKYLPTQSPSAALFFWDRIKSMIQKHRKFQEETRFGGAALNIGLIQKRFTDRGAFMVDLDRQWLLDVEQQERQSITSCQNEENKSIKLSLIDDTESQTRDDIRFLENKARTAYATVAGEHLNHLKKKKEIEESAIQKEEFWKRKTEEKHLMSERIFSDRLAKGTPLSEYRNASFTEKYLLMLEMQERKRKDPFLDMKPFGTDRTRVRSHRGRYRNLDRRDLTHLQKMRPKSCKYCPNDEVHATSHWIFVGAPLPQVPRNRYMRLNQTRAVPCSGGLSVKSISSFLHPVTMPYIF